MNYLEDQNFIIKIIIIISIFFICILFYQDYNSSIDKEKFNDVSYSYLFNDLLDYNIKSKDNINYNSNLNDLIKNYKNFREIELNNELILDGVNQISNVIEDDLDFIEDKKNTYKREHIDNSNEYKDFLIFFNDLNRNQEQLTNNFGSIDEFYGKYKINSVYKDLQNFSLSYGYDNNGKKRFNILNNNSKDSIQFNNLIKSEQFQINMPTDTIKIELVNNPNSDNDLSNPSNNPEKEKIKQLFKNLNLDINGGVFYLRRYNPESNEYTLFSKNKIALLHLLKVE